MKELRLSLILFLSVTLFACSNSKEAGSEEGPEEEQEAEEEGEGNPILEVDKNKWEKRSTDHFKVLSAQKRDRTLSIRVEYSGGCEDHDFELWASPFFEKSDPPRKRLFIKHEDNGDACRSVIEDTLRHDLSSMKTPVILKLEGHDRTIRYGFE